MQYDIRRKYDHVSDVIDNIAWLRAPEMIP